MNYYQQEARLMRNAQDPYWAWHRMVEFHRGKAKEHTCVNCTKRALDWALKREYVEVLGLGRFHVENLDAYQPMCRSCHLKQDREFEVITAERRANIVAAQSKRFREKPVTLETRAKMVRAQSGKKRTPEQKENYRTSKLGTQNPNSRENRIKRGLYVRPLNQESR